MNEQQGNVFLGAVLTFLFTGSIFFIGNTIGVFLAGRKTQELYQSVVKNELMVKKFEGCSFVFRGKELIFQHCVQK